MPRHATALLFVPLALSPVAMASFPFNNNRRQSSKARLIGGIIAAALILILIIAITISIVRKRRRSAAINQSYIPKPNTFSAQNQGNTMNAYDPSAVSPVAQEAGYGGYNSHQWGANAAYGDPIQQPGYHQSPYSTEPPSGYGSENRTGYTDPNHTGQDTDNTFLPPPPSYDEGKNGQTYPPPPGAPPQAHVADGNNNFIGGFRPNK